MVKLRSWSILYKIVHHIWVKSTPPQGPALANYCENIMDDHSYAKKSADHVSEHSYCLKSGSRSIPKRAYTYQVKNRHPKQRKIEVNNTCYSVHDVPGDGNCFFHCLSLSLFGDFSQTEFYRQTICQHIFDNWENFQTEVELHHQLPQLTRLHYMESMVLGREYAISCEIAVASRILHCNIHVWLRGVGRNKDKFHLQSFHAGTSDPSVTVLLHNSHFSVLQHIKTTAAAQHNRPTTERAGSQCAPELTHDMRKYFEITRTQKEYKNHETETKQE